MKIAFFTLIGLFIALAAYSQAVPDTVAIKHLLEKESTTYRSGDWKAHAACWKIQPYTRIVVSTSDGKMIDVPPAMMVNQPENRPGSGGAFSISNFKVSVMGNSAWVSHDEVSTSKDGKNSYSAEFKMLEKINGEWKIVGMSVHLYNK